MKELFAIICVFLAAFAVWSAAEFWIHLAEQGHIIKSFPEERK